MSWVSFALGAAAGVVVGACVAAWATLHLICLALDAAGVPVPLRWRRRL